MVWYNPIYIEKAVQNLNFVMLVMCHMDSYILAF